MADRQPIYMFGTFRLLPRAGVLQDNGRDVRLGSRAIGLLTALVERGGEVAPSAELIARVWPTTTVDEQNLRVQIAGLRKALADGHGDERFIATVPGHGYRFVAPVADTLDDPRDDPRPSVEGNLPAALTRLFGRSEVIDDLRQRLAQERAVSIVGPGGVGKTSVAVAAAHEVAGGAAWFADLGPVADPALIPTALLETFGLSASPEDMSAALSRRLDGRSALLVLDNCEHLIESCATITEALLGEIRGLRILATSREPLRTAGEWVIRLPALETPAMGSSLEHALTCSAAQLFVQRAASGDIRFSLTEDTLPAVIDICRRLEGMPLALELAAATVRTLGVHGVAQRLRERLELPGFGRRTAAARQATLSATLDWSYQLLSPSEQRALRRFAIFQGAFALESAVAVAGLGGAGEASALALLTGLAEKSLLSVDLAREDVRYRLLQTTRSFALERLTPREAAGAHARHAREVRRLAEAAERVWRDGPEARRDANELIDELTAATEWALSPAGDVDTAVDLAVAASGLRRRLSRVGKHHARQWDRVQARVRALSPPNPSAEMRLLASSGLGRSHDMGGDRRQLMAAAERLIAFARELGDSDCLMVGLWDRASLAKLYGDSAVLKRCASQMREEATLRPPDVFRALACRVSGQVSLLDGDVATARRETEAGVQLLEIGSDDLHLGRLGLDAGVYLYDQLAPILWAQGFPDQAMAAARASIARSRRLSHGASLIFALVETAAQAALLAGDAGAVDDFLDENQRLCDERGESLALASNARTREFVRAVQHVERTGHADAAAAAIVAPGSSHSQLWKTHLSVRIAEAVGRSQSPEAGLAALDAVSSCAGGPNGWMQPELLRARAALLKVAGEPTPEIEALLRQALRHAAQMGALSLELRSATALAELLSDEGRAGEGLGPLSDVMGRLSEGRHASDYRRAASLRDRLRTPG